MDQTPEPVVDLHTLGPVETNCFVVRVPDGPDPTGCWVVDCGMDPDPMIRSIEAGGLEPRGIFLTHCHWDHIGGIEAFFARFGVLPMRVHPVELAWNRDPRSNLSAMSGWPCIAPEPDLTYEDGARLDFGGSVWRVLHLPGHSPGSVGLLDEVSGTLIAGDTLFAGSIGRVDFPTSDEAAMKSSLARLMTLPDETTVLPGHGPKTSIGMERLRNPFLNEWGLA